MENLWEMIAKARGVELNEEFIWEGFKYKINNIDGLLMFEDGWFASRRIHMFIKGYGVIEKLPFKPQKGDKYYTIILNKTTESYFWDDTSTDYARLIAGVVFRTIEEARLYVPTWLERISKL